MQRQYSLNFAILLNTINVYDSIGAVWIFNYDSCAYIHIDLRGLSFSHLIAIRSLIVLEGIKSVIEVAALHLCHNFFDTLFLADLVHENVALRGKLLHNIELLVG